MPAEATTRAGTAVAVSASQLVLVEYPMPIMRTQTATDAALDMVGGIWEVCHQARETGTSTREMGVLELQLAPVEADCELAKPLVSERIEGLHNSRFTYALRITRRRRKSKPVNNAGNSVDEPVGREAQKWSVVSAELLGRVRTHFHWTQLCEPVFQLGPTVLPPPLAAVPDKFFPPAQTRRQDYGFRQATQDIKARNALTKTASYGIAPNVAGFGEVPQMPATVKERLKGLAEERAQLEAKDAAAAAAAEGEGTGSAADGDAPARPVAPAPRKKRPSRARHVSDGAVDADAAAIAAIDKTAVGALRRRLKALDLLQDLFRKQPMWIRMDIQGAVPPTLRFAAVESLPLLAYTIMKGPFRNYWVRYGYSPYEEPLARFLQIFSYRISDEKFQDYLEFTGAVDPDQAGGGISTAREHTDRAGQPLLLFGQPLARQISFYMHKLSDRVIQDLLLNAPRLSKPCLATGWFTTETLRQLRDIIAAICDRQFQRIGGGAAIAHAAEVPMTIKDFLQKAQQLAPADVVVEPAPLGPPPPKSRSKKPKPKPKPRKRSKKTAAAEEEAAAVEKDKEASADIADAEAEGGAAGGKEGEHEQEVDDSEEAERMNAYLSDSDSEDDENEEEGYGEGAMHGGQFGFDELQGSQVSSNT
eukprot:TRINITY_DN1207_c0_g1_i1.p1 TRINITY_DN1207_c0_g1~~TRINITY_DN1207_c0_g1_i1.p1  ORF type:complete len:646 (-),score=164.84 TRINITY_DN1207_c0_g1_i1:537-2474(-)